MPERQPMSEAMYYILLALLHPVHGYGVMQRVRELSGGRLVLGFTSGDTALHCYRIREAEGYIRLESAEGRRKVYAITEAGTQALLEEYRRLKTMVQDGNILEEELK